MQAFICATSGRFPPGNLFEIVDILRAAHGGQVVKIEEFSVWGPLVNHFLRLEVERRFVKLDVVIAADLNINVLYAGVHSIVRANKQPRALRAAACARREVGRGNDRAQMTGPNRSPHRDRGKVAQRSIRSNED